MATQTKENYLKALFALHQKNDQIKVTDLAKTMGVSAPTITDMVKKLEAAGWVNYKKYKPICLTSEGLRYAATIIRKHRLSEIFLTQIMGFGWEEVHDIAEEMEHLKSVSFFTRMDELLDFPNQDPHGSPIPDVNGHVSDHAYQLLSQVEVGVQVKIMAIRESSAEFLQFLNKKNIRLKTHLTLVSRESFDQSVVISYNGEETLMISEAVSRRLYVKS